jgi:SAM-dependent methyltransferase
MSGTKRSPPALVRALDPRIFIHEMRRRVMSEMSEQPKTPPEMYEQFYVPAIFRPLSRYVLEAAALRTGEGVLDLACGTGILARQAAATVGEAGRVTALDLRPGMLAVARSAPTPPGASIDWKEGDATATDLPADTFDVVLCQQGLQFFADRLAALREMRRVARRGGRVVLAVWQGTDRHEFFRSMAEIEVRHLEDLGFTLEDAMAPFSLGDGERLRKLSEEAGLENVEVTPASIEAIFPARGFVRNLEFAYAAVMPHFAENPPAFDAFVEVLERETEAIRERYRRGDHIAFPMHTNIVTARA